MNSAVILLSGGIDSTVVLAQCHERGIAPLHALTFDYGQTLAKEIIVARDNAAKYGAHWKCINLDLREVAPTCSILGTGADIKTGRTLDVIAADLPTSYVPFRNGIFLAYAAAYAEARGITQIMAGCNGYNSGNYPDDSADFISAFNSALRAGTQPNWHGLVIAPNTHRSKAAVVRAGLEAGVSFPETWSCYRNGQSHCGGCDSCVVRAQAMAANGLDIEGRPL